MPSPRDQDIQLEPPIGRGPDIAPAVEDRSYLVFIAGALLVAVAGGFLLAILLSLAASGTFAEDRVPYLTQAHGWAQLQGWAGLFVAGMALRIIPRFAGRPPLPASLNLPVFALLFAGAAGRAIAQGVDLGEASEGLLFAASLLAALGSLAVAATLAVTLAKGRKRPEPWRYFAWAGAAWWAVWAVLHVSAGLRALDNDIALVPPAFDDTMAWVVMLGAIANFVWGIQSRSVPVFFGRKTPTLRRAVPPGVLLNAGVLLIPLSRLATDGSASEQRLFGAGLALAGIAFAWLAPLAGSVYGKATRLRPRARAASRYVLGANILAVVAGVLLASAGLHSFLTGEFEAPGARDAARHAIGLGPITMLILGMAQLIAPVFALERAEATPVSILDRFAFWALVAAAALRVASGLLWDTLDYEPRMHLNATAGTLAWLALVAFAIRVVVVVRKEPRMKQILSDMVADARSRPGR